MQSMEDQVRSQIRQSHLAGFGSKLLLPSLLQPFDAGMLRCSVLLISQLKTQTSTVVFLLGIDKALLRISNLWIYTCATISCTL